MNITPYIGEIRLFAGQTVPKEGWALCDGTELQISGNEQLYSRIGNNYGGDGWSTFALPDLRGRVPVHIGSKPDTVNLYIGQKSGNERTAVVPDNLPAHTHQILASDVLAGTNDPNNASLAKTGSLNWFASPKDDLSDIAAMHPDAITTEGVDYTVPVVQYYLTINYIIATEGI